MTRKFSIMRYPRDMRGYGAEPPQADWPEGTLVAVQIVVNYEEGGENCILHGDAASEAFLSEIVGAQPWPGQRHWNMESIYDYGARAGFWRLHRLLSRRNIPVTVFGVATALARSPEQVMAMKQADWEIASHGLKWIDYRDYTPEAEADDIEKAIALHTRVTGTAPQGWYTGRCSVNTVDLVSAQASLSYIADSYADELPYWHVYNQKPQLIVPYTLDANDMRFATNQGFNTGDHFFTYLKDSFDCLYREGLEGHPKMMSVGLHCRLAGRPGRVEGLMRWLDYIQSHNKVWMARRIDIANHWHDHHPFKEAPKPSQMSKQSFMEAYGGVFEHSAWVAERAYESELAPAFDSADGLWFLFHQIFDSASRDEKQATINAHPDLAGKLAVAKQLTPHSSEEQASAGLDRLTEEEFRLFNDLNKAYRAKFGFPFIIAVKDHNKSSILSAFKERLTLSEDEEFNRACHEINRIAYHRLKGLLS